MPLLSCWLSPENKPLTISEVSDLCESMKGMVFGTSLKSWILGPITLFLEGSGLGCRRVWG